MNNEIPVVTIEQIEAALKNSARGGDELNRQLKEVFGVCSDLVLRITNASYSKGFDEGRQYGLIEAKTPAPEAGVKDE